ncbi:MAG: hypothetical protein JWM64_216 [Frankiales bacterium]|nr:hypothetical protein [Frankiales bacterium]
MTALLPPLVPAPGLLPPRPQDAHDLTEVRAWARSVGYPVDESASLPLDVLRTYRRVHAA